MLFAILFEFNRASFTWQSLSTTARRGVFSILPSIYDGAFLRK